MTELPDYSHALADPGPEPVTEETFFDQGKQLPKILAWARARRVAPWALFFAILIRVSASTPHTVRLPGLIGGQASLNLFAAFVSRSGGGKGISDKVARLAWPTSIEIRMLGSGEGLSEMFVLRGPETEDNERLTAAILSVNEIDTLTGLASRQGSIILAQLKSAWMGEPLGQSNASKATSRHVDEHSYRLCMSVGCQYGHGGVIFGDTSGGTPQRFLWAPTEDPGMPYGGGPDPEPLDTAQPLWRPDEPGVTEIAYGIPEIEKTVIGSHLARQRGEADALNGHALLSRCKVAAVIAIMHQRAKVTQLDWELSGIVMQVSDRTRDSLLDYDRQASRAKIRARAIARADGEEFYVSSRLETVKRSILRMLERDGEQAGSDLRRRLGTREKRDLFDQAISLLEHDGFVASAPGRDRGLRYRIGGHRDQGDHPENAQVSGGDHVGHRDQSDNITDLDSRRSPETPTPKLSAARWLAQRIPQLREEGVSTIASFAVCDEAEALGYNRQSVIAAASKHPDIRVASRGPAGATVWCIDPEMEVNYQTAGEWVAEYLATLPADATEVDKDDLRKQGEAAGHIWDNLRHAARAHPRIESVPAFGQSKSDRVWLLDQTPTGDDQAALDFNGDGEPA